MSSSELNIPKRFPHLTLGYIAAFLIVTTTPGYFIMQVTGSKVNSESTALELAMTVFVVFGGGIGFLFWFISHQIKKNGYKKFRVDLSAWVKEKYDLTLTHEDIVKLSTPNLFLRWFKKSYHSEEIEKRLGDPKQTVTLSLVEVDGDAYLLWSEAEEEYPTLENKRTLEHIQTFWREVEMQEGLFFLVETESRNLMTANECLVIWSDPVRAQLFAGQINSPDVVGFYSIEEFLQDISKNIPSHFQIGINWGEEEIVCDKDFFIENLSS